MARIGLNTSISGLTGELIIRWVKASAPLAEVGRLPAAAFPYDAVDNLTDLDPVVYIVQWWRSDDGVALDQLIKDWAIDASLQNLTTLVTYQYVTDRGDGEVGVWADPEAGDTTLVDTRLDGVSKSDLILHEAGYGNYIDADYDLLASGGIELLFGKQFDADSRWFVTVSITESVPIVTPSTVISRYIGVEVLSADTDFYTDATDNLYNKLVIADFSTTVGQVTFGDLALIPDGTFVTFQTERGAQNYLTLQFDPGDSVRFLNDDVNVIYLAKCESISLFFYDGVCYVTDYRGRNLQRGQVLPDYDTARATNTTACILADEATGVLDSVDYPGLYEWLTAMPTGKVPLGAGVGQWSYDSGGGVYPNKRFYGIDTGAGTFRVPHLSGVSIKVGSTPGTYEADNVGS